MDEYISTMSDEERAERRAARIAARKKRQHERRMRKLRQMVPVLGASLLLVGVLSAWGKSHHAKRDEDHEDNAQVMSLQSESVKPLIPEVREAKPFHAAVSNSTVMLGEEFPSKHALLIDVQSGKILAEKDANTVISPASMTKILTLLVAVEHLNESDLDKTVTITREITDYCYVNDCSVVGLMVGEEVPVRELLYGTILSSGADTALALANYVAGSHEAFVEMMNDKLEELGLSDTAHFTNCVGLYHEDHYCTIYDIAMILKAAMDLPLCQEVLDARTYETLPTTDHPNGQILSNWFLRRIEDKDTGRVEVVGAKTGFVVQAGNCAASAGRDTEGRLYLCVTANAQGSWRAIYDHVDLYQRFCPTEPPAPAADAVQ